MTKTKVLVVEDYKPLAETLEYQLNRAGYEVLRAGDGREAIQQAKLNLPDVVFLDVDLPILNGIEVCKQLRMDSSTKDTLILMLSALGEESDQVVGFAMGADDYVVKPYSVRELMLRVRAVLRRHTEPVEQSTPKVTFGILSIDAEAYRVWVGDQETLLTALEFKLLLTLIERKERVQTRDTLLNDVWGYEVAITTRTVDTHVKRLREKLGKAGQYIETVRGIGYRMNEGAGEVNS